MELGILIDDDLFESKVKKADRPKQKPYNVKICVNESFLNGNEAYQDEIQRQNATKFQADFWYRKQEYSKALGGYLSIHNNPQIKSTTVERDIDEAIIRCYLKIANYTMALEFIALLVNKQAEDTSLLLLLAEVCSEVGYKQGEVTCFKRCISLHSYNHNFWYSLAKAYSKKPSSKPLIADHVHEITRILSTSTANSKSYKDCLKLVVKCCHCACISDSLCLHDKILLENYHKDVISNLKTEQKSSQENDSLLQSKIHDSSTINGASQAEAEIPYFTVGQEDFNTCSFNMTIMKDTRDIMSSECTVLEGKTEFGLSLISFFCLLRTRFLLQRAIWTSMSFVKEKLSEFMSKVENDIKICTVCSCGEIKKCILKQLELEDTSLVGQKMEELDMHSLYQGGKQKHWT